MRVQKAVYRILYGFQDFKDMDADIKNILSALLQLYFSEPKNI